MTTLSSLYTTAGRRLACESPTTRKTPTLPCSEHLDKADVARLSPSQISQMSNRELVRVLRASELPMLTERIRTRLELLDRTALERLVYLARRCCRNQGY